MGKYVYKFLNHEQEKAIIIISNIHQWKSHYRWHLFFLNKREEGDTETRQPNSQSSGGRDGRPARRR